MSRIPFAKIRHDALLEANGEQDGYLLSEREASEAAAALVQAVEAIDRYVNWHEPRIVPSVEIPDKDAALRLLRASLEPFGDVS